MVGLDHCDVRVEALIDVLGSCISETCVALKKGRANADTAQYVMGHTIGTRVGNNSMQNLIM